MNTLTVTGATGYIREQLIPLYPRGEVDALSRIILTEVTGLGRSSLLAEPGRKITASEEDKIIKICADLKRSVPIQYILGKTEFYGITLFVTPQTLIPRQETEELVDLIIKENSLSSPGIVDIGTGSGAIAVALAVNIKGSRVVATDISVGALEVAGRNSAFNECRVELVHDNLHNSSLAMHGKFDIIVSNPPYVTESEKGLMHDNVLLFEPHGALFVPDSDPLVAYRSIARLAPQLLLPGGKLYLEINERYGREVSGLLEASGLISPVVIKDIHGKDRFVKAVKGGEE